MQQMIKAKAAQKPASQAVQYTPVEIPNVDNILGDIDGLLNLLKYQKPDHEMRRCCECGSFSCSIGPFHYVKVDVR